MSQNPKNMISKIEAACQIASEFSDEKIDISEAELRFVRLGFSEEDNTSRLVKALFEMALSVSKEGEFSTGDLEKLFDVLWFFWDYSHTSDSDTERHSIISHLSHVGRNFNLHRYYKDPDTVESLYAIKVKKCGWMKSDGTDISESEQMKRIHSILEDIFIGSPFKKLVRSYNIN